MATEPTKFPEWASVPAVDPGSGQPNVSEPAEAKKDSGFNFKERPPRQDFNWLFNLIYGWIQWFKQERDSTFGDTVLVPFTAPALSAGTGSVTFSVGGLSFMRYHVSGNKIWASIYLRFKVTSADATSIIVDLGVDYAFLAGKFMDDFLLAAGHSGPAGSALSSVAFHNGAVATPIVIFNTMPTSKYATGTHNLNVQIFSDVRTP